MTTLQTLRTKRSRKNITRKGTEAFANAQKIKEFNEKHQEEQKAVEENLEDYSIFTEQYISNDSN